MPIQTTYPDEMALAFEGMLGHGSASGYSEGFWSDEVAYFGRAVVQGASVGEGLIPIAGAGTLVGISHHSHDVEVSDVPGAEAWPANKKFNVRRKGLVWVFPETAVATLNDPIYYRHQNAGADPEGAGRFRIDDDAASGDVTLIAAGTGWKWRSLGSAGEPVLLEVNIPS